MLDNLKYHLSIGVLKALAILPLPVLYVISDGICFILDHVIHYRRKVIDKNLAACFPDMSHAERIKIRKEFYRHLSDTIVESVKLLHISDKQLDKRIEVVNADLVNECEKTNTPVILFLGHYGNWEWVQNISRHYCGDIASFYIYKPLRDKVSDRVFQRIRSRFNADGIPQKGTVRALLKFKGENKNFIVGFIADHRSNSKDAPSHVNFMGLSTPYYVAAEPLGKKIKAKFLYLDVEKTGRGKYRFTFQPIEPTVTDTPNPVTEEYFRMLERTIRRQPPYWLWSHRRWLFP